VYVAVHSCLELFGTVTLWGDTVQGARSAGGKWLCMSKLVRWISPSVAVGGLVAGLIAAPIAEASSAANIIKIKATSPNYPGLKAKDHGLVDGYALVIYKDTSVNSNTAKISGTVTTTATNDMATLMAEPFGAKSYSAVGAPVSLGTLGVNTYSFSVTPSLATSYEVQVAGTDSATSNPVTVYVVAGGSAPEKYVHEKCSRTRCTFSYRTYTLLVPSAYKTESDKHLYLYLAIGDPRLPKDLTLTKSGKVSRAKRVSSGEYWETLTYYIPIKNTRTRWRLSACTKDTESKDGIGLPGHHSCGDKHIPNSPIYLG
jgi:hypothetical protein